MRWTLLLLTLLTLLVGCAKKSYDASSYETDDYVGGSYAMAEIAAPSPVSRSAKKKEQSRSDNNYPMSPPVAAADEAWEGEENAPAINTVEKPSARMVHYDGHAHLRVTKVDETVDTIITMATDLGGHLESMNANYVTVRVPVDHFDAVFARVLALGDVVSKSVYAEDVTESFMASDLRLRTAQSARDRLVALLAQAEDEEEKLRLVREIQRVSEEIDRLESQVRTLRQLAAMSRITVELSSRQALAWSGAADETAEFGWIRQLSPFGHDRVRSAKKLRLTVPVGMVALSRRGPFVAESADGARIWSGRLDNQPRGDTGFWISALRERLERDFASVEVVPIGAYQFLRLVDRSDEPYIWMVGVSANGKYLDVVELFFLNAEQEQRYRDAVTTALTGGAA